MVLQDGNRWPAALLLAFLVFSGARPLRAVGRVAGSAGHGLRVGEMLTGRVGGRCWLVNGKKEIKEPTGPVYELLRQIGIKVCPAFALD